MVQSRRSFLTNSFALGCSLAASPLVTPVTFASIPTDKRLVVLVLRGGTDALDIVAPVADPLLIKYRPRIKHKNHLDLDGFFALHPEMAGLMPMWKAGELAVAHAVATPYRGKRSHFDGQDLLEAGMPEVTSTLRESGWMNRMLELLPNVEKTTAFSVGRENMLTLRGDLPTTSWAPESRVDLSAQGRLLLDVIFSKDPMFADAGETALTLTAQQMEAQNALADEDAELIEEVMTKAEKKSRADKAKGIAAFAADRLKEDTRFATFSIGGWDTHQRQDRTIRKATQELQSALLTLQSELGPIWDKTAVVCMTEFGRTARENGTGGTDHGTGGAMIMAGGAIKGRKVYGDWPGLDEADLYLRRDLMPTSDLRRYVGWLVHDMFGVAQSDLSTKVFPGLDMLHNPKFIR